MEMGSQAKFIGEGRVRVTSTSVQVSGLGSLNLVMERGGDEVIVVFICP